MSPNNFSLVTEMPTQHLFRHTGAPSKGRVAVAMSGGVDSSVAAYLLARDGYDVVGVTMRLWDAEVGGEVSPDHRGCCSIEDIEDARRVCQTIGAPHYVIDARGEFRAHVIDYFVAEYRRGRTPHPCIACNDRIKFDFLMRRASMMDAKYVATGHYAQVVETDDGELTLRQGVDPSKDQSYVLFGLGQVQLRRVLLPVGAHSKAGIRNLAREAGLHLADKADSQEVCFIPSGDYRTFMRRQSEPAEGEIVDASGRVVGSHSGVEFFTVGQRRGIGVTASQVGLAEGSKVFVTKVDAASRRITVGGGDALLLRDVRVGDVRYVAGKRPSAPVRVDAKIRYNGRAASAVLHPGEAEAVLRFDEPQRAVTPGQAAVFYEGDRVLGGGYIDGPAD